MLSRPLTPAVHSNRTTVVPLRRVELDRFFLIVSVNLSNVGVYPSGERSPLRVEDDPQKEVAIRTRILLGHCYDPSETICHIFRVYSNIRVFIC